PISVAFRQQPARSSAPGTSPSTATTPSSRPLSRTWRSSGSNSIPRRPPCSASRSKPTHPDGHSTPSTAKDGPACSCGDVATPLFGENTGEGLGRLQAGAAGGAYAIGVAVVVERHLDWDAYSRLHALEPADQLVEHYARAKSWCAWAGSMVGIALRMTDGRDRYTRCSSSLSCSCRSTRR